MDIEVRVKTKDNRLLSKSIHLHEDVPLEETENVLHHAFKSVVKEVAQLRKEEEQWVQKHSQR